MYSGSLIVFKIKATSFAEASTICSLAQAMATNDQEGFEKGTTISGRGSIVFSVRLQRESADDFQDFLSSFSIVFEKFLP